uniref:Uncharacterized protein n=1 Tax=Leersia perrieri TaxID=77586 RepID=A0A0D9WQW8_9ORYZ
MEHENETHDDQTHDDQAHNEQAHDHQAHDEPHTNPEPNVNMVQQPAVFCGAERTVGISSTYVQSTISNHPQAIPGKKRKQKQPGMLLGSSSKEKSETPYLTKVVLSQPSRHGLQKQPDAEGGSTEAEISDYMFLD